MNAAGSTDPSGRDEVHPVLRALERLFVFVGYAAADGTMLYVGGGHLGEDQAAAGQLLGARLWDAPLLADSPEARRQVREACRRAAEEADADAVQVTWAAGPRRLTLQVRPVSDAEGRTTRLLATAVDATERMVSEEAGALAAERTLRESEQRHRQLVETANEGIWTIDAEGRTTYVNRRMAEMLGCGVEEMLGRLHTDFMFAADRPKGDSDLEARRQGTSQQWDQRYRRSDGTELWALASCSSLFDDEGQVIGALGMFTDITERRRADQALRESEERFRRMTDGLPSIVWMHDAAGEQEFVNQTFCDFFGVTREEMRGGRWQMLMHPEDAAAYSEEFFACVGAHRPFHAEVRVRRADGEWRWIESRALPRFGADGEFRGYVGSSPDVTERKQAEEALRRVNADLEARVRSRTGELEQRAEQLARLASELTIAEQRERQRIAQTLHDHLQQLLVAARLGVDRARRRGPNELQDTLALAARLIDESVDAARSLSSELAPPILHADGLAAGLEWLARWMHAHHELEVRVEVGDDVVTDREDLRVLLFQAVRELLFNVVKHAGVREARVRLERDGHRLRVTVADEGLGFDPQAPLGPSCGFGLTSVRDRIALFGGGLEVESEPGQGSRVTLEVPLQRGVRPEATADLEVENPTGTPDPTRLAGLGSPGRIRVLLVDDHEVMRDGLASLLEEEEDIDVVGEARDGSDALDVARRLRPDVVLMDVSMPRMDGLEATRRLCRELPGIVVVGLSMYEEAERSQAMLDAGAVAYLSKSAPSERLVETVRGAYRRRRVSDSDSAPASASAPAAGSARLL